MIEKLLTQGAGIYLEDDCSSPPRHIYIGTFRRADLRGLGTEQGLSLRLEEGESALLVFQAILENKSSGLG